MDTQATVSDIAMLAYQLKSRKVNKKPTVLFVGARAGGLFRSEKFYSGSQQFTSRPSFGSLPLSEKFGECFQVLKSDHLGETDRHNLLSDALQNQSCSPADVDLAKLVKEGVFDIIISTNIDGLLEEAFNSVNLRPGLDYQVRIPERFFYSEDGSILTGSKPTLVKVFGDLAAHQYRTKEAFYLNDYRDLKRDLESYLRRDVLLIGFDPTWDQEIDDILPSDGGSVCYVDKELPAETSRLSRILKNRNGSKLLNITYDLFLQKLYNYLREEVPSSDGLVQAMSSQIQEVSELFKQIQEIRRQVDQIQEIHERVKQIHGGISYLQTSVDELRTNGRKS
ncbi:MAG: hypothetical protein E6J34_11455 [Chloroflexi bacterium]|nr:MAG: hypothetical protein E6J34_11455 [Chloroflexota bacterium]